MTLYWIKEYIFVLLAYGVVMFAWPEIVLRKYLKGHSLTMRICFDVLFMVFATNIVVLTLGLCHILNLWVVRILFWGILALSIIIPFVKNHGKHIVERFGALLTGGYGIKSLGNDMVLGTKTNVGKVKALIKRKLANNYMLYFLLIILLVYGMIYFSVGVFETPSYGFGDLYVHHRWIYDMKQGQIFSHGIYPEGMHTVVYLISVCFGIPVYSVLLFLQPIHIVIFFLAIYFLCREMFSWRYTGILVLLLFLILDYGTVNSIYAFSRFQWTLPQEFGAFSTLLCPVFLLRFLKAVKKGQDNGKINTEKKNIFRAIIENENLVLFSLSLFGTIAVHFYCTIIAFFLCVCVVPVYIKQIFSKQGFVKLLLSVVITFVLAVLPMMIASAEGIPFQGSIGWAMKVINGETYVSGAPLTPAINPSDGEHGKIDVLEAIRQLPKIIRSYLYGATFNSDDTSLYLWAVGLALAGIIVFEIISLCVYFYRKKKGIKKVSSFNHGGIFVSVFMLFAVMIMSRPTAFGLPQLVEASRMCYYATLFNIIAVCIPIDLIFASLNLYLEDTGDGVIAITLAVAISSVVVVTDKYHGSLFFEYTRFNPVVDNVVNIINENEKGSFTIVSPVDDTWQIAEYGYHEELIRFVNGVITESYKIPTEKVYIFIEKHPLRYAQMHFPNMPKWLANSYSGQKLMNYTKTVSTGRDFIAGELDEEAGERFRFEFNEHSSMYKIAEFRVIVESRAMNWIMDFDALYPRTIKVYYEDEDFVCYYFEQNPMALYELALQEPNPEFME